MAQAPLPFTSLNAATATGAGSSKDLEGVYQLHTLQIMRTGGPTTCTVLLEGSHDGTNWYTLGTQFTEGSTGLLVTATTHLVRHVRANLTALSGGASPTVTATIASA